MKATHNIFCTNSSVPVRPETSRDKFTFTKETKKQKKDILKQETDVLK
jgi:hypothetical protein